MNFAEIRELVSNFNSKNVKNSMIFLNAGKIFQIFSHAKLLGINFQTHPYCCAENVFEAGAAAFDDATQAVCAVAAVVVAVAATFAAASSLADDPTDAPTVSGAPSFHFGCCCSSTLSCCC